MSDLIANIQSAVNEYIDAVEREEHRRKCLKIAVNPEQFDMVREAVKNGDSSMEHAVLSRAAVPSGKAIVMDTSILEDWEPHFSIPTSGLTR